MCDEDIRKQVGAAATGASDQVRWGIRAVQLTNEFRAKHNLSPLMWNQNLCDVGMEHSKNMADGVVPFSHQGFDQRSNKVNFYKTRFAENVAYN